MRYLATTRGPGGRFKAVAFTEDERASVSHRRFCKELLTESQTRPIVISVGSAPFCHRGTTVLISLSDLLSLVQDDTDS